LVITNKKPKKQRDGQTKSEQNPKFEMKTGSGNKQAVALQLPGRRMVNHLDTYFP